MKRPLQNKSITKDLTSHNRYELMHVRVLFCLQTKVHLVLHICGLDILNNILIECTHDSMIYLCSMYGRRSVRLRGTRPPTFHFSARGGQHRKCETDHSPLLKTVHRSISKINIPVQI